MQHIITVKNRDHKKLAKWLRSVVYDDALDTIFIPAIMSGTNEEIALLNASYDGMSMTTYGGHLFLPLEWVRRENGSKIVSETCDKIIKAVRKECPKPKS